MLILIVLLMRLNLSTPNHLLIIIWTTYIMRLLRRHVHFVIDTIDLIVLGLLGDANLTWPCSIEDLFAALLVIAFLAHHDDVGNVASFCLSFDRILLDLIRFAIRLD